jgi:O-antigen ligase/Tfp pilus assembly protein PilF
MAPTRPSAAHRAAFSCLVLLAVVVPLTPQAQGFFAAKHIVYLALASLGMLCVWTAALRRERQPALGTPTDVALLAFLAAAIPSGLAAANDGMARFTAGVLLAAGLTYLLALKTLTTPRRVRALYIATLGAALVVSILGLVGYDRFLTEAAPEVQRREYLATDLFPHSYLAAQYLVPVLVGGMVLLFERALPRRWSLLVALALLPVALHVVVIGSRGAYLAVTIALLAHLGLRLRSAPAGGSLRPRLLARAAGFAVVALLVLAIATLVGALPGGVQHALERVLLVFDPQASEFNFSRLRVWIDALRMASDHMLLGVGPGCFDTVLPSYHHSLRAVSHAHNQFLHVLAELGLLGLIPFLFLVRCGLHAARRGAVHLASDERRRPLFHAAVAALAAMLTFCLYETPLAAGESAGLIMILLAVTTRAGCADRDREGRPLRAAAEIVLLGFLLTILAPTWAAYANASGLTRSHLSERDAAARADTEGREEEARMRRTAAADLLAEADAAFPWRPEFQATRADLLYRLGRYDEALAASQIADRRAPGTFRNLNAIGTVRARLGNPEQAIEPLRRAISAHRGPEAAETYLTLGRAFEATGQYEQAWLIYSSLLGSGVHYDSVQPTLLLDAVRTLIALDRNLHAAPPLLDLSLARVPDADHGPVLAPRAKLDEMLARPRRPYTR